MPIDALPEGYVIGPDNQSWLMRLKKKAQFALAAGPRSHGFWKWRDIPITLIGLRGKGIWRYEDTGGDNITAVSKPDNVVFEKLRYNYISRIQPWARWGIVLQWPLFFNCWFIYREKDVVSPPRYKSSFGIFRMFTFGVGFKRDADKVYWATANMGGNFE